MNHKTTLIIGATGATGKALTDQLLADDQYDQVIIFVRRAVATHHTKLTQHIINFDDIASWQDLVRGDVLFSCLGTTRKDAGSKDAQRKVDFDYQYQFASIAKQNGVGSYVLVSSMGANAKSALFYPRIKGELEQAAQALNFGRCVIVRPPILQRPDSDRWAENMGVKVLAILGYLTPFAKHRPLKAQDLAHAMRLAERQLGQGVHILESVDIWQLLSG